MVGVDLCERVGDDDRCGGRQVEPEFGSSPLLGPQGRNIGPRREPGGLDHRGRAAGGEHDDVGSIDRSASGHGRVAFRVGQLACPLREGLPPGRVPGNTRTSPRSRTAGSAHNWVTA